MFYRWHPQLALRYLPIVSFIKKTGINNPKILEVGSGSLGIGPYLNQEITGVDKDFSGPFWPKLKQVKGRAEKLPFKNNSFNIVLSVDVLEHLPPSHRLKAIAELFRVATDYVIIAVPCGPLSLKLDQELAKIYQQKFKRQFPFLKEHLKFKLPQKQKLISWINAAAQKYHKSIKLTIQGNRNLKVRKFLMQGWMTDNFLIDLFFRKILLFFIPLLRLLDKHPPHYRQIFFINILNSNN